MDLMEAISGAGKEPEIIQWHISGSNKKNSEGFDSVSQVTQKLLMWQPGINLCTPN